MDLIQAIITGVVQGLTEFLPVSSTGHLVLTSAIFKFFSGKPIPTGGSEDIFFDVMLHVGTLVALFIYFRHDIVHLTKAFFRALREKTLKTDYEAQLPIYIVVGTIATIAIVLPFKDIFEADMGKPAIVGLQIVITGLLLFITEFLSARVVKKVQKVGFMRSILIGLAQGIAVSPGISRSGATIAAGLAAGLDRVTAARYSFLMSIPIITMAALYDAMDNFGKGDIFSFNWVAIIVGTVIAGVVGYYCIKYFILYLSKHSLNGFGVYCCVIGLLMYLLFTFA